MIDGIILASGFSERMGCNKLLLPVGNCVVIESVIEAAIKASLNKIFLVYREPEIKKSGDKYGLETIENKQAHLGQAESVKLGVAASKADGYLFIAGDQPFITPEFLDSMISRFNNSGKGVIVPVFNGKIEMPILFSKKYKDQLLLAEGDRGGFDIIENNPSDVEYFIVDDRKLIADVDTLEEYIWVVNNGIKGDNNGI
ncbi:MAG: nucleotidyltransferase family protein [Gudongella sp.]|jgi:molybdenum cofactor cytidylyltransferase|nr:nucleotidyltransferase family protein [Gudongella sp.]